MPKRKYETSVPKNYRRAIINFQNHSLTKKSLAKFNSDLTKEGLSHVRIDDLLRGLDIVSPHWREYHIKNIPSTDLKSFGVRKTTGQPIYSLKRPLKRIGPKSVWYCLTNQDVKVKKRRCSNLEGCTPNVDCPSLTNSFLPPPQLPSFLTASLLTSPLPFNNIGLSSTRFSFTPSTPFINIQPPPPPPLPNPQTNYAALGGNNIIPPPPPPSSINIPPPPPISDLENKVNESVSKVNAITNNLDTLLSTSTVSTCDERVIKQIKEANDAMQKAQKDEYDLNVATLERKLNIEIDKTNQTISNIETLQSKLKASITANLSNQEKIKAFEESQKELLAAKEKTLNQECEIKLGNLLNRSNETIKIKDKDIAYLNAENLGLKNQLNQAAEVCEKRISGIIEDWQNQINTLKADHLTELAELAQQKDKENTEAIQKLNNDSQALINSRSFNQGPILNENVKLRSAIAELNAKIQSYGNYLQREDINRKQAAEDLKNSLVKEAEFQKRIHEITTENNKNVASIQILKNEKNTLQQNLSLSNALSQQLFTNAKQSEKLLPYISTLLNSTFDIIKRNPNNSREAIIEILNLQSPINPTHLLKDEFQASLPSILPPPVQELPFGSIPFQPSYQPSSQGLLPPPPSQNLLPASDVPMNIETSRDIVPFNEEVPD